MAMPRAVGHPDYSAGFIPQIWSTNVLVKYYENLVAAQICNTDYEGEIKKMGDKVWIPKVPTVTARTGAKGQDLIVEKPDDEVTYLEIDRYDYFNVFVDDVDKYQSNLNLMRLFGKEGGYQLKLKTDTNVLGTIYSQAHASNAGATAGADSEGFNLGASGSPIALTKENVLQYIIDCGTVLDEQDVPDDDGWWMVVPPWFVNLLKKSDIKDASLTGDDKSTLRNGGRIGRIDNFTFYKSKNITTASDGGHTAYYIQFGHKDAVSFAAQITDTETIRSTKAFGNYIRGRAVYGFRVLKSEALGTLYAYKG